MTRKTYSIFFTVVLALAFINVKAQNEKDFQKKKNDNGINTRKESKEKLIEAIVGTWQVHEVFKGKKDISNTDTLAYNQTLIFDREGKYVSHSGGEKIDSGLYRLNENHSILYLESETEKTTSEWRITFDNNGMILQPQNNNPQEAHFKYVYSRADSN